MPSYTTWNPDDKHADITLSGGNLVAICTVPWKAVRAIIGKSLGKWYWEVTIDDSTYVNIGVGTSAATLANYPGSDNYGCGIDRGGLYNQGAGLFTQHGSGFVSPINGDIVSVAFDMDAGEIYFALNGVWAGTSNPATGTNPTFTFTPGITLYPMMGLQTSQVTANFGASAFSYSVPSGFNSGLYEINEVVFPSPLLITTSLQLNVQIELVPGVLMGEVSMSIGEVFWGNYVDCPSPFTAQTNLQSNLQLELVSPIFIAQSGMSVGEIFWGYPISLPSAFLSSGSLQANTQVELTLPLIATSTLFSNLGVEVSAGVLNAIEAILAIPVYPVILEGTSRVYFFTLTGEADSIDDIVIPISSFQSRIKSGDPTYLSVVIPSTEYATDINLRLNGDLVVRMGYKSDEEILLTEIISRVTFENIIINEGSINKSITLDGHKTETWIVKEVDLKDSSYKNLSKGKLRYRCKPDLYLKPGDTANINGDTFVVNSIVYSVSPGLETYEVAE